MKTTILTFLLLSLPCVTLPGHADALELKSGSVLNGKYVGGTAGTVRFETSAGVQVIETANIIALTFTAAPAPAAAAAPAPAPAATAAPAAAAAPAAGAVTVPTGTVLLVRMVDTVSSQSQPGAKFTTKLETDLVVNGAVAAKAGTVIYGKVQSATQARRARGKSTLELRLDQMVAGGGPVALATSGFAQAGEGGAKQAARGAAAGAAIGAIAGDAGTGAAIGATAGAVKKGDTITVPAGTLLEFTLTQPVSVKP